MASDADVSAVPDWLVVGFSMPLLPGSEDGGLTPDQTALYAEGCAEVQPPALVEAWARHTLNWITRWDEAVSRLQEDGVDITGIPDLAGGFLLRSPALGGLSAT